MAKTQTTTIGDKLKPSTVPSPAKPKITAIFKIITCGTATMATTTAKEAKRAERGLKNREKIICAPLKMISQRKPRKKKRLALFFLTAKKTNRKMKTAKIKKSAKVKRKEAEASGISWLSPELFRKRQAVQSPKTCTAPNKTASLKNNPDLNCINE